MVFLAPDDLARRNEVLDDEIVRVRGGRIKRGDPVPSATALVADTKELAKLTHEKRRIWLGDIVLAGNCPTPLGPPASQRPLQVQTHAQERGKGDVTGLLEQVTGWEESGTRALLFCDNKGQAERLSELMDEAGATARPELRVGTFHAGFVWPAAQVALLTDHELFDRYRRSTRKARFRGTGKVADSGALKPGDYCVHVDHGIARFLGLRRITADGIESECLLLEYAGGDKLYVPTDKLLLVERYDVPDDQSVQVHKLGGATWERAKKRARKAIMAVAQELLTLYASREALPGVAFSPDTHLVKEMENAFIHEETRDQTTAVEAVKRDMEQGAPDGPAGLRGRGLRQDRGRDARGVQGGAGRAAGRGALPDHDPRRTAPRDLLAAHA